MDGRELFDALDDYIGVRAVWGGPELVVKRERLIALLEELVAEVRAAERR